MQCNPASIYVRTISGECSAKRDRFGDNLQFTQARLLYRSAVRCLVYGFRDTTLMPNIHGLMPLVALLFAPFAEMRYDTTRFVCLLSANHLICEDSSKLSAYYVFFPHSRFTEKTITQHYPERWSHLNILCTSYCAVLCRLGHMVVFQFRVPFPSCFS